MSLSRYKDTEYQKKYRERNKEKLRLYRSDYYEANKDKLIKRSKEWSENNPEKRKEISKRWADKNLDKKKDYQTNYRKTNPKKYLYSLAKRRADRLWREFTITLDDLPDIPEVCPLLGLELDSWSEGQCHHPSIDRIDSSKGYVPGNVWFISQRANMIKNNATADELLCLAVNLIKKIEDK